MFFLLTISSLCTRFATELILRRGSKSPPVVTIVGGDHRTEEERTKLKGFKGPTSAFDDFAALITAAEEAMGLDKNTKGFSTDVLRIEISGPKQPHLTLVSGYSYCAGGLLPASSDNSNDC